MSEAETDGEVEPKAGEWIPGENAADVSELERIGRLAVGHRLYDHADELHAIADGVLQQAFDGEDVRRENLEAVRREMHGLEFVLETYVEPIVEESEDADGGRGQ